MCGAARSCRLASNRTCESRTPHQMFWGFCKNGKDKVSSNLCHYALQFSCEPCFYSNPSSSLWSHDPVCGQLPHQPRTRPDDLKLVGVWMEWILRASTNISTPDIDKQCSLSRPKPTLVTASSGSQWCCGAMGSQSQTNSCAPSEAYTHGALMNSFAQSAMWELGTKLLRRPVEIIGGDINIINPGPSGQQLPYPQPFAQAHSQQSEPYYI